MTPKGARGLLGEGWDGGGINSGIGEELGSTLTSAEGLHLEDVGLRSKFFGRCPATAQDISKHPESHLRDIQHPESQ